MLCKQLFLIKGPLKQLENNMSQLMRLWYLSHRQPAKAQASLHICAVSPEPLLFAHMKYGSRQRVQPKIKTSSPTRWLRISILRISLWEDEKCHNLMTRLLCSLTVNGATVHENVKKALTMACFRRIFNSCFLTSITLSPNASSHAYNFRI